ncbi:MAG: hypothetical protein ACE3JK_10485 [Sporolactobacillus sp.]
MIAWLLPLCMIVFAGTYAIVDDWMDKRKLARRANKKTSAGTGAR